MGRCQVACQSMEDDHLRNICSQPPRERSFSLFVVVSLLVVVSFIPFAHIFVGKIVHTTRLAALLSTSNVNSPPPSPHFFSLTYSSLHHFIQLDCARLVRPTMRFRLDANNLCDEKTHTTKSSYSVPNKHSFITPQKNQQVDTAACGNL